MVSDVNLCYERLAIKMNVLWEGVKATVGIVGQAAVETGMKGKLQADLLLISHEIENRKRAFGEELYEYVVRTVGCRLLHLVGHE